MRIVAMIFLLAAQFCARAEDVQRDGEADTAPLAQAADPVAGAAGARGAATSLDELKGRLLELKEVAFGGELAALPAVPVFVEFAGSPLLSAAVAQDLRARGVRVAASKSEAEAVLTLSGRVQLDGSIGRRYFDIGATFEKIAAADEQAARIADDSAQLAATAAARDAAMAQALYRVGLFDKFLHNYFSVAAVSDALGIRGRVNTWIAGDPRGFCLTNCEHWKHIHHTLILFARLEGVASWKGHVLVKAWMEKVDPQPVFDVAYESLLSEHLLARPR